VPTPDDMPKGCRFAPRCSQAMDICHQREAPFIKVDDHSSTKCWLFDPEKNKVPFKEGV
jgi:peptide/nickel transport system ATP-binding protein